MKLQSYFAIFDEDAALAEAQKLLPNVFKSDAFNKNNAVSAKLIALETSA